MDKWDERAEVWLLCHTPNICSLILEGQDYRCSNCLNRPIVAAELRKLENERDTYQRLYKLRGKALESPCPECGCKPSQIIPLDGNKED